MAQVKQNVLERRNENNKGNVVLTLKLFIDEGDFVENLDMKSSWDLDRGCRLGVEGNTDSERCCLLTHPSPGIPSP